ncbi:MAG: PEGA domain-containing protein [Rhodospirillaceae bacterium]|jgi:hypothetical protein|nr:PEGA domain-containing protein [Rhodospirillaceae bacterium]
MYKYFILALIAFGLFGCATITQGTNDALYITSNPEGASVITSNGYSCAETPCAIQIPKKDGFTVTLDKKGCKPKTVNVVTKMSTSGGAAMAGNVILGGIIGAGVDAATGASKELVPNPLEVNLEC